MLWLPQPCCPYRIVTNIASPDRGKAQNAFGTLVTSNGTTLLDGAVTELIAAGSNVRDSWGIEIFIHQTGASATIANACVDILVGGATDDVLIASLICGYSSSTAGAAPMGYRYFFPIHIPAGLRIAATHANVIVTKAANIAINLYGGGVPPFRVGRKVTTLGTPADNARGVVLTVTASGGAPGVTQMTASSAEDYFAFNTGFQPHSDTTITPVGFTAVSIGVGASTEENIGTQYWWKDTSENCGGPLASPSPIFRNVPAGTRLSLLCSGPGANDTGYNGLIYAVS